MTAFDRFDPFEQRIVDAIGEIATPRRPDYLDDVLGMTARTPQRARWTFPGRWIPAMDRTLAGPARMSSRALLLVAIAALLALAATTVFIVGSRLDVPSPVGPARNGAVVFPKGGDIWIKDSATAPAARTLIDLDDDVEAPFLSRDGRTVAFVKPGEAGGTFWAAGIDGADIRQLLANPVQDGWSQAFWSSDSTYLLLTGQFENGTRRLYQLFADGSPPREIVLPRGTDAWDAIPSPVDPDLFLLRSRKLTGAITQRLSIVHLDGTIVRTFDLTGTSSFGEFMTLSGGAWSPDGRTIAYNSIDMDPDTLATAMRVHVINVDGTGDRALPAPDDPAVNQGWPSWSPDGRSILLQRFRFASPSDPTDGWSATAILPADGSSTGFEVGGRIEGVQDFDQIPSWSPDGRSVIRFEQASGQSRLIDVASGTSIPLELGDDIADWQRLRP